MSAKVSELIERVPTYKFPPCQRSGIRRVHGQGWALAGIESVWVIRWKRFLEDSGPHQDPQVPQYLSGPVLKTGELLNIGR